MDYERRARRQSLRIIISEAIMVLTVIIMVIVLALVVSGYWINSNLEVERQGMLQMNSIPTGANIQIDGEELRFQRTNSSKILTSGEHEVKLYRDGYDTWTKTVDIREGLLYRLNYPHLFLQEREKEDVYDATGTTFATISSNRNLILLANKTTKWVLLNLESTTIKPVTVDISNAFSSVSLAPGATSGLFNGEIISAKWDNANEHVLFKAKTAKGDIEWVLISVRNPARNINITREFATVFDEINIFDNSASNLLAIRNGNLHKINVESRQISALLARDITSYNYMDNEIIYSTANNIYTYRLGDDEPTLLEGLEAPAKVLLSRFYDTKYITTINGTSITVYNKDDLEEVGSATLSFLPAKSKIGHDGDFVFMQNGNNFAVFDMESLSVIEWSPDSKNYGWITNYMMYAVKDGELIVYDFDGLNRRSISTNVSERFPVTITNDRMMYYFSDDQLIREWLIKR